MNPFHRVDNRLVHGQIISTWVPHLRLKRFLVASDTVPHNALQMTMFRMCIPSDCAFDALPVAEAAAWLHGKRFGADPTIVLMETLQDAVRLFAHGHPFPFLNIGNVHHAPGREPVTNAVYLGAEEWTQIGQLAQRGVKVEVRSLPTEPPIDVGARALER